MITKVILRVHSAANARASMSDEEVAGDVAITWPVRLEGCDRSNDGVLYCARHKR